GPENPEGLGDVTNDDTGQITAPGGTVVLAAGDVFSTALRAEGGVGRVEQNGTINADGIDGDGGSVSLTSGDIAVLGSTSQTTANAGTNGNGGEVVVYSPGSAIFEDGARVEAKGGSESGNGGFFELSGKEYVEVVGDIDLTAANGKSGMFLIDPLDLTIVDVNPDLEPPEPEPEDGGFTGPGGEWQPSGTGSELDIDILEGYLGLADVTLSTVGTVGPEDGDIIFDADRYLYTAGGVDNSLIVRAERNIEFTADDGINFEGNGHVELYAGPEGSVTTVDKGNDKNNPNIWTAKGDIIIEAGRGGIDVGVLRTGAPSTSGFERPGEIRLQTIKDNEDPYVDGEYDITTEHLRVEGKGYGSVYVNSDGDLTINGSQSAGGAVHVNTNAVADDEDALSFICLTAERDVTINSTGDKGILADAHGNRDSIASIWIGAGTNVQDPVGGYSGTITIDGDLHAKASAPGSQFAKSEASIKVFASDIVIAGEPHAEGVSVDVQTSTISTTPFIDEDSAVYDGDGDGELIQGSLALVWIDETQDGTCLNCGNVQRRILPIALPDWFNQSKNIMVYAIAVLANDEDGGGGSLIGGTVDPATLDPTSYEGGTLTLNLDGTVTYEPPTDWVFDENGEFTDYFEYYAVDSDGDVSEEPALVTITLTNAAPDAVDDLYAEVSHNLVFGADDAAGVILGVGTDTDPDNTSEAVFLDDLDVVGFTQPSYGEVIFDEETGAFTYTPDETLMLANTTLEDDTFTYTLSDGFGGTDIGTVTIDLTNLIPVANPDFYDVSQGTTLITAVDQGTVE
ncbi:MAG: Ig-like domain-containing protein, partial [Planctomycetota bacterium]